jgi:hypothetical protein
MTPTRFPALPALLALVLVSLPTRPARAGDDAPEAAGEPKWRLEATPYNSYYGSPMVGIYRRLGARSSLGLGLSGTLGSSDGSGTDRHVVAPGESGAYANSSEETVHDRSIAARLEWRHRQVLSPRANWYWGVGLSGGYFDGRFTETGVRLTSETSRSYRRSRHEWGGGFGGFVTLGAEWVVASHFGVSMALTPLSEAYQGRTIRRQDENTSQEEAYISRDESSGWSGGLSLAPSLNVVLRF